MGASIPRKRESSVMVSLVFAPFCRYQLWAELALRVSWRTLFALTNALSSCMSAGPSQVSNLSCLSSPPIPTCRDLASGHAYSLSTLAQLLFLTCLCKILSDGGSCLVCPCNSLTRQHRAAARAHRETSPQAAARSERELSSAWQPVARPSVWPVEGQGTGSCQPGSQQVVAGLNAQCGGLWAHPGWGSLGSLYGGNWHAVPREAVLLACCLCKPGTWASIGSQLLSSMGHKQPCETVCALTFLFGFSNFFFWHCPVLNKR